MARKALITGITGQDGAYLAALLLEQGYEVYGTCRSTVKADISRLKELCIQDSVKLVQMNLLDSADILSVIRAIRPGEIYNLAAQSFVAASFKQPVHTGEVDALGVARLLEAICAVDPEIRFFQASSAEIFGNAQSAPQTEDTPFQPRNPYGTAKLYGHLLVVNYRDAYNMHVCNGILYNHESPLRGRQFVTRKITSELALIRQGREAPLELGNIDAKRDWGFAADYVRGMWLMLQNNNPEDFIIASGESHTVRDFITIAAACCGFDIVWEGMGVDEIGTDRATGKMLIRINPEFYRPAEAGLLQGSPIKAEKQLGWQRNMSFVQLVETMMKSDIVKAESGNL